MTDTQTNNSDKQLLHLVLGGELLSISDVKFSELEKIDLVGVYPDYATAYDAWKEAAQRTVDNAHVRYFVVPLHEILSPDAE